MAAAARAACLLLAVQGEARAEPAPLAGQARWPARHAHARAGRGAPLPGSGSLVAAIASQAIVVGTLGRTCNPAGQRNIDGNTVVDGRTNLLTSPAACCAACKVRRLRCAPHPPAAPWPHNPLDKGAPSLWPPRRHAATATSGVFAAKTVRRGAALRACAGLLRSRPCTSAAAPAPCSRPPQPATTAARMGSAGCARWPAAAATCSPAHARRPAHNWGCAPHPCRTGTCFSRSASAAPAGAGAAATSGRAAPHLTRRACWICR